MNLVTGATGIIGSHVLLHLLENGKPLIAVKQNSSNTEDVKQLFRFYGKGNLFEAITWADADLTDIFSIEDLLEGISTVYHCAGYVSFDDKEKFKLKLLNETVTANVVNACLHKGVNYFCHVSSVATINNNDYNGKLHESVFWKTSGHESYYAISKYNAEREVWRGGEEGLNIVIVNPGVVISPVFSKRSSGRLLDICRKGSVFYTEGSTAYVAAPDVAKAMVTLTENKIFGERFILNERHYTNYEMMSMIQEAFGNSKPRIKVNKVLLYAASGIDALMSFITRRERKLNANTVRASLGSKIYCDDKIKKAIHFSFTPVKEFIQQIAAPCLLK